MKKLLVLLTLLTSLPLMAQQISSETFNGEWQLLSQAEGLNVYIKKESCSIEHFDQPLIYAMIRIENTSSKSVSGSFTMGLHYDVGCYGCDGQPEASRSFEIEAGETLEGNCEFENTQLTFLISNPNHDDVRIFNGIELLELNKN